MVESHFLKQKEGPKWDMDRIQGSILLASMQLYMERFVKKIMHQLLDIISQSATSIPWWDCQVRNGFFQSKSETCIPI